MRYALPDVSAFVDDMSTHWESALGNIPNDALKATWKQMGDTFERAITESHDSEDRHWRVLQPATGTGKTQGLCLYLANLVRENRSDDVIPVGALVVVRLIQQAEEVRDTILRHLESSTSVDYSARVVAHHSDRQQSADALAQADVLVITHAQYLKCFEYSVLDTICPAGDRWDRIAEWKLDGPDSERVPRRLTVIDEALDVVRHRKVTVEDLGHAVNYIPSDVRDRFQKQLDALKFAEQVLRGMPGASDAPDQGRVLWREEDTHRTGRPVAASMEELIEALEELPAEHFVPWWGRKDQAAMAGTRRKVVRTLRDTGALMAHWAFYYGRGRQQSLNHSDLAVPLELVNPVLLDATASHSALLRLFGERVDIRPCPENARLYGNVTLRRAILSGGTGKHAMAAEGNRRAALLFDSLVQEIPAGSRVLVICHKAVRPCLEGYRLDGSDVAIAHYGALDGLNEWQDFDTVVLFGTFYRPHEHTVASYFAATGKRDNSVFEGPKPCAGYEDVLRAICFGQRMSTMIQAINRIRCRRVVDGVGNCEKATVFVTLPPNEASAITASLSKDMPGLEIGEDWSLRFSDKPISRRSSFDEALRLLMENLPSGRHSAKFIRERLNMTLNQWKKMASRKLVDPEDPLTKRLAALGVTFQTTGRGGRGGSNFLVKV